MTIEVQVRAGSRVPGALLRGAAHCGWLAAALAVAPYAPVSSPEMAVAMPVILLAAGAVLVPVERAGAGVTGLIATSGALAFLSVTAWGEVWGSALFMSAVLVLLVFTPVRGR